MKSAYTIQKSNPNIKLHRIGSQQHGIKLLEGYDELRFVSYVTSLKEILKLREKLDLKKITGIIGYKMVDHFKEELKQDRQQVAYVLEMIKNGELLLYYPTKNKVLHDKYYHLHTSKGEERVIIGSPNLTKNGLYESKQQNNVLVIDVKTTPEKHNGKDNPIESFSRYFQDVMSESTLFMQDLLDSMETNPDQEDQEIIDQWLAGNAVSTDEQEAHSFVTNVTEQAFKSSIEEEHTTFEVTLPNNQNAKKQAEKLIPGSKTGNDKMLVDSNQVLFEIKQQVGLPLMTISKNNYVWKVYCQNEQLLCRTKEPNSPQEINNCLQLIEDYCNTVDLGETNSPNKVKTSLFEAILYFLASPFMHHWMKEKQKQLGHVHERGPRYLLIYGGSGNGKSTFVKYMLQLLCGQSIGPLQSSELNNSKLSNLTNYNTLFPTVFDDVEMQRVRSCETFFKTYWERKWDGKINMPQIILTSNRRQFYNWFNTRALICDFEVKFTQDIEQMQNLNYIMDQDNDIFCYFSYFYLNRDYQKYFAKDELVYAREVMKDLYQFANRPFPAFFPEKPIDQLFDKDHEIWIDLVYNKKKARIIRRQDSYKVEFDQDIENYTVNKYFQALPQTMNAERLGNQITVSNKKGFDKWFYREQNSKGFWQHVRDKLKI